MNKAEFTKYLTERIWNYNRDEKLFQDETQVMIKVCSGILRGVLEDVMCGKFDTIQKMTDTRK